MPPPPDPVDEAISESFPASDPPSWAGSRAASEPESESATPLLALTQELEEAESIDPVARAIDEVAAFVVPDSWRGVLRGNWLGHALHPLLTDLALGFWLGAGVLDVFAGKRGRSSASTLVGWGVVAAVPTLVSGLAEWSTLTTPAMRRVATVHGVGNIVVSGSYLRSWLLRRRGRQARGVTWGMLGATLAWITGYLGGHLSFARQAGTGTR